MPYYGSSYRLVRSAVSQQAAEDIAQTLSNDNAELNHIVPKLVNRKSVLKHVSDEFMLDYFIPQRLILVDQSRDVHLGIKKQWNTNMDLFYDAHNYMTIQIGRPTKSL
jgi:hypothetical protein